MYRLHVEKDRSAAMGSGGTGRVVDRQVKDVKMNMHRTSKKYLQRWGGPWNYRQADSIGRGTHRCHCEGEVETEAATCRLGGQRGCREQIPLPRGYQRVEGRSGIGVAQVPRRRGS